MYSRYDPTARGEYLPVAEMPQESAAPVEAAAPAAASNSGLADALRGLLGSLDGGRTMDVGDLLLLAIIALLVLESGDQTDLIIVLAVALIVGF